jgi:hypothetical protein
MILVSLPWVWSHRHQISGFQAFVFISKIVFGIFGNYIYYEIVSSSPSTGLLRALRRIGLLGHVEYVGGARTPAASASNYTLANVNTTTFDSHKTNIEGNEVTDPKAEVTVPNDSLLINEDKDKNA